MTNRKNTTRARLVASALAMLLCVAMLVGTTFAWFSDSASTGDTTITAGNLDVEIVDTEGQSLEGQQIFTTEDGKNIEDFLWEPGAMWTSEPFVIKNNGTLALTYALDYSITNEKDFNGHSLTEVIQMKVVDVKKAQEVSINAPEQGASQEQRKNYWDQITTTDTDVDATTVVILPGDATPEDVKNGESIGNTDALQVVLYWQPDSSTDPDPANNPDNLYNNKGAQEGEELTADFALSVFATQTPYESDSFGDKYDEKVLEIVGTADELVEALADPEVDVVELSDDIITVAGSPLRVSAGKTVNGQGHTITGARDAVKSTLIIDAAEDAEEPTVIENLNVKHTLKGETGANNRYAVCVNPKAKVELKNVNVDATENFGYALKVCNGADVTVKDGSLSGYSGVEIWGDTTDKSKLTLEDVTITGNAATEGGPENSYAAIVVHNNSTVADGAITMTGCTVITTSEYDEEWPTIPKPFEYHILLANDPNSNSDTAIAEMERIFGVEDSELTANNTFKHKSVDGTIVDTLWDGAKDYLLGYYNPNA